jgi:hypothetical protein
VASEGRLGEGGVQAPGQNVRLRLSQQSSGLKVGEGEAEARGSAGTRVTALSWLGQQGAKHMLSCVQGGLGGR